MVAHPLMRGVPVECIVIVFISQWRAPIMTVSLYSLNSGSRLKITRPTAVADSLWRRLPLMR